MNACCGVAAGQTRHGPLLTELEVVLVRLLQMVGPARAGNLAWYFQNSFKMRPPHRRPIKAS